jgi:hypothetical protein
MGAIMQFKVQARIEKVLWSSDKAALYQIRDINSKREKRWNVFSDQKLNVASDYELSGYCTEAKDKKLKDENARDIWRTTFNVTDAKNLDGTASESTSETDFPF